MSVYILALPLEPPPRFHPSRLSQSAELPLLYRGFPLAICLTCCSVYMSVLPFPFVCPASPCPQVHSLPLHLYFWPADRFICTSFLDCIYTHQYTVCISFWLTSLSMTDSGSTHTSTNDSVLFLFVAKYCSIVHVHHIFIHSSVDWCRWFPCPGYYR